MESVLFFGRKILEKCCHNIHGRGPHIWVQERKVFFFFFSWQVPCWGQYFFIHSRFPRKIYTIIQTLYASFSFHLNRFLGIPTTPIGIYFPRNRWKLSLFLCFSTRKSSLAKHKSHCSADSNFHIPHCFRWKSATQTRPLSIIFQSKEKNKRAPTSYRLEWTLPALIKTYNS